MDWAGFTDCNNLNGSGLFRNLLNIYEGTFHENYFAAFTTA